MSFGAARMHRGLVDHPTAKRASMKVALVKESGETRNWVVCLPRSNYVTEGIHDVGGAMPSSNVSPSDPSHDWSGSQQGDRPLENDIA